MLLTVSIYSSLLVCKTITKKDLILNYFFEDKMYSIDPWEKVLDFYIMPMRMSLLVRGVGLMLNHPVSMATGWKPIALEVLKNEKQ